MFAQYGKYNYVIFNHAKSFLLQIGLDARIVLPDLKQNSLTLQWVSLIKYLVI